MKRSIFSDMFALARELKLRGKSGTSLRMRLFAFLSFFLLAIIAGVLLILILTGTFNSGAQESYVWMENELAHLNQGVYSDFGKLSLQGITFSESVALGMEKVMRENGTNPSELQAKPELLSKLLDSQIEPLIAATKAASTSGAFIILDATVNPKSENAKASRAGLFLKSTEPNIATAVDANIRFLRGPADVARAHTLELMPQWHMEFEVHEGDYYNTAITNARENAKLPLSRLYRWSDRLMLAGNSESGMLLCVPIISKSGVVFGVCGFEISSMSFKTGYSPDNTIYPKIFSTLSPVKNDMLDMSCGLIAGNYYHTNVNTGGNIAMRQNGKFKCYTSEDGVTYGGLHQSISLYPSNSVYSYEVWLTAVMMPESELEGAVSVSNRRLFLAFFLLLVLCLAIAAFISRRYIAPVLKAISMVKAPAHSSLPKTNILEIDDLFEFLAKQDDAEAESPGKKPTAANTASEGTFSGFTLFKQNISTLSPAEKSVFNLYMLGHTAGEIADILCLSINTIKTHNKRIYMKLNVSSRSELMVYVQMLNEENKV